MLKHGRAGVPMEVMGLMLGEFVDDYTVRCWYLSFSPPADQIIDLMRRCLCDASIGHDGDSRECGPCLPDEDAGHVEADRTVSPKSLA